MVGDGADGDHGTGDAWQALQRVQLGLRDALQAATSEDERVELLRRLRETRDELAQLENSGDDADPTPPTDIEGAAPSAPVGRTATINERGREGAQRSRRAPFLLALLGLLLLLGAGAAGYALGQRGGETAAEAGSGDDAAKDEVATPSTSEPTDDADGAAERGDGVETVEGTDDTDEADADEDEADAGDENTAEGEADETAADAKPSVVDDPLVVMELQDYRFALQATVADDATARSLEAAVERTFGEFGTTDVSVDQGAEAEPWAGNLADLIQNVPRLIDGSLAIGADAMVLTGRAPSEDSVDFFDGYAADNGFPPIDVRSVEVVDLEPATFDVEALDGVLALVGTLPNEDLQDRIVEAAIELYGAENVIVDTEIDDETYALFDAARFDDVIAVFHSTGGDFDVKMVEGGFFGVLDSGIEFQLGLASLTGNSQQVLTGFRDLIQRTTVEVTIEGHTDSTGTAERNQVLSEARARSVADFLVDNGVDPVRLVVVGHGESQPVAANSTQEGRAKNRRVAITMGFEED